MFENLIGAVVRIYLIEVECKFTNLKTTVDGNGKYLSNRSGM